MALVALVSSASWAELPVYRVDVDAELSALRVTMCRTPTMPNRFALESTSQQHALRGVELRRGRVVLAAAEPACLDYRFELDRVREERRSGVMRLGEDVVATPGAWLLAPADGSSFEVHFTLPRGVQVSAPWLPLDVELTRYRVGPSPSGWEPVVAFGRFEQFLIDVPGGRLDVAVLDGSPRAKVDEVRAWVTAAAGHVTLTYGVFPVPRAQVVVVPVAGIDVFGGRELDDSMPFARVLRRGGIAAQFFYNQLAPLDQVLADWTATHEFSHMLLPYVRRADGWLSEGFASYYQNVLRARGGALDEATAWRKLHEGFERGRRDDYSDTLAESIRYRGPNMIMRMYWSGAAIALLADVELRKRSGGTQSLDTVLADLRDCCLPSNRTWTAMELFERLDALSGTTVFADLYARWVDAEAFPDVDAVFDDLGVRPGFWGLRLVDAPAASIRREIMASKAEPRH